MYIPFWQLRDRIGPEKAAALIAAFGGGQVYIPGRPDPDGPLASAIGIKAARQLASHARNGASGRSGGVIELPSRVPAPDLRLAFMLANPGLSERELVKRFGVHGRTVRRLRARLAGRPSGLSA